MVKESRMQGHHIEAFLEMLSAERGAARNTLDAYRRDLVLLGQWLAEKNKVLMEATEPDLNGYFAARHGETRATTA
ncbi:MAG: site-specific integrase, partial [Parvibaculum sp.]